MTDERLIGEVERHAVIYNRQKTNMFNGDKSANKEMAWLQIAHSLGSDPETCKKRWKYLRERYVQQKKTGDTPSYEHLSRPYLEKMRFLDSFIQPRKSYRNVVVGLLNSPSQNGAGSADAGSLAPASSASSASTASSASATSSSSTAAALFAPNGGVPSRQYPQQSPFAQQSQNHHLLDQASAMFSLATAGNSCATNGADLLAEADAEANQRLQQMRRNAKQLYQNHLHQQPQQADGQQPMSNENMRLFNQFNSYVQQQQQQLQQQQQHPGVPNNHNSFHGNENDHQQRENTDSANTIHSGQSTEAAVPNGRCALDGITSADLIKNELHLLPAHNNNNSLGDGASSISSMHSSMTSPRTTAESAIAGIDTVLAERIPPGTVVTRASDQMVAAAASTNGQRNGRRSGAKRRRLCGNGNGDRGTTRADKEDDRDSHAADEDDDDEDDDDEDEDRANGIDRMNLRVIRSPPSSFPGDFLYPFYQQQQQQQQQQHQQPQSHPPSHLHHQPRSSEQLLGELVTAELLKMDKAQRKVAQKRILRVLFFDD